MSYQTSSEAFHGKTPVVLLTFTVGSTVYRWATHDIATPDGMYEGKIVDSGSIDREVVSGRPAGADINIRISNHDGGLDALVSDFTNNAYTKGSAVISRGFLDLSFASFEIKATLDVAEFVGYSDNRLVEIRLTNENKFLTGIIEPPTVREVVDALMVADPTNFNSSNMFLHPEWGDEPVPVIAGSPHGILRDSGWVIAHVATKTYFTGQVGTIGAFPGALLFGGVSKYGFNVYAGLAGYNGAIYRSDGEIRIHASDFYDADAGLTGFAAQSKVITLNGETWHVLLMKVGAFDKEVINRGDVDAPLIEVRPQAKPEGVSTPREWTMAEVVQGIFESATGNSGTWSSNAITADWTNLSVTTNITSRYITNTDTDVMSAIGNATSEAFVDTYVSAEAKLGVINVVPVGGPAPDYSSKQSFTEENNIISLSVSFPAPGTKWGLATRVLVGWSDKPGNAGDGIRTLERSGINYVFGNFGMGPGTKTWASANTAAETAAGKDILVELGGYTVPSLIAAKTIASRVLALRSVPRPIIYLTATIGATQVELGDIVRITHSAAPWTGEHVGVVYAIDDNLDDHTVKLIVIDLDSYLTGKAFRYNSRASWVHADTISPNLGATISITNGSNTVTASAVNTFDGVLAGDILRIDEGSNRFEVIVADTDQNLTLTTSNLGGPYGPLSSTYTTASGIIAWSILRSQATRSTTPAKAGVALDSKYGAFADGADDLFLDDTTPPFKYS